MAGQQVATVDPVLSAIHVIRGQRVMLDADLAALYGVSTKRLSRFAGTGTAFRRTSCFGSLFKRPDF